MKHLITAVLSGALLCQIAGCGRLSEPLPIRPDASSTPSSGALSSANPSNSAALKDFTTFALNALLLPLLDDDVPARWADPSLLMDCHDARVTVDGDRPDVGAPVPAAFRVRWHMEGCTPLGQGLELSGDVDLSVESNEVGYTAHVHPKGLKVSSITGVQTLSDPFTARLAVDAGQMVR